MRLCHQPSPLWTKPRVTRFKKKSKPTWPCVRSNSLPPRWNSDPVTPSACPYPANANRAGPPLLSLGGIRERPAPPAWSAHETSRQQNPIRSDRPPGKERKTHSRGIGARTHKAPRPAPRCPCDELPGRHVPPRPPPRIFFPNPPAAAHPPPPGQPAEQVVLMMAAPAPAARGAVAA